MNIKFIIENADAIWHEARWNGEVKCECGCTEHYDLKDGRYKCKACRKVYSDTTGTLLHHSRLEKWQWLVAIWYMSNTKGISTVELAKHIEVNYQTAHMVQQKIRYSMANDTKLQGVIRIDEAYLGGWSNMHLKKKLNYLRSKGLMGEDDTRYWRPNLYKAVSLYKAHIISMVDEHGNAKILQTPKPISTDIIRQIVYREEPTMLVCDESQLYKKIGLPIEQSNHTQHIFMTPNGLTSNICENIFSWVKRKWNGIYTHTSEKYLQLYLNQMTFSFNHKDDNVDDRFNTLLGICAHTHVTCEQIYHYNPLAAYIVNNQPKRKHRRTKPLK